MAAPNPADEEGASGASSQWFRRKAPSSASRMSALAEVMTGVAKAWTREFDRVSSLTGEIAFKASSTRTVEDTMTGFAPYDVFATLQSTSWLAPVGLRFSQQFVAVMVEALFGGVGDEEMTDPTPGPLSPIEASIADVIGAQLSGALTKGFADTIPTTFIFERVQAKVDPTSMGKPQSNMLVSTFVLNALGRKLELDVLFPQVALDAMTAKLKDGFDLSQFGSDPLWSERLETEIHRAPVTLTAILDTVPMSLGDVARLKVGQVLELPAGAASRVRLTCEDRDLFRCDLGQSVGAYTVRINAVVGSD